MQCAEGGATGGGASALAVSRGPFGRRGPQRAAECTGIPRRRQAAAEGCREQGSGEIRNYRSNENLELVNEGAECAGARAKLKKAASSRCIPKSWSRAEA